MQQVKVIIILLFCYLLFSGGQILAQTTPVPTQVPGANLGISDSSCGFANITGADKCCINNVSEEQLINDTKSKVDSNAVAILDVLPKEGVIDKIGLTDILSRKCYLGEPTADSGGCICKTTAEPTVIADLTVLCNRYYTGKNKVADIQKELEPCISCVRGGGLLTGIGCVPINLGNFVSNFVLSTGIGLGGVFSLLCIIYSAFMMQTSQGSPEKIKKAQENLTSCIIGLVLIIFSIFILRFIGVTIIKIPGFS